MGMQGYSCIKVVWHISDKRIALNGMVLIYLAGYYLYWRTVAWISISFAILPLLLMYLYSPESPTWLVSRGRNQDALKACKIISVDKAKDLIHQRRVRILEREHERKSVTPNVGVLTKFFSSITKPTVYKPFFILTVCFFFQQMSGIYVLIFYAVKFFKDIDDCIINAYVLSIIVGLIRMFVGFITSQLLFKYGRRILCLTSLMSMTVLMFISGSFILFIQRGYLDKSWVFVPIISLLFYICTSTMGLLSVPWTMTAEMYPIEVRGIMQGVTVCVAHLLMFIEIKSFYWLKEILGGAHGVQLFYSGICIIGFICLFIILPETHNKSLEEIEEYFKHNIIYIKRNRRAYSDWIPVKTVDANNQKV